MNRDHHLPVSVLGAGQASDRVFSGLPAHALRQLCDLHSIHDYPSGAVLFQEGEPAEGIFLVCSGAVKLSVGSSHGDSLLLRAVGPGEILGLSATLTGQGHEVTAQTTTAAELAFIRRKDFLRYLREHSDVCLRVVESLSNDVQAAYDRVRTLGLARMRHSRN
jgi:CRP/FNR family transcriptional regulator, cyclic AMP receptor protein